jgi:MFS family permease
MIFATSKNKYMEYTPYIIATCCVMLVGFIIFMLSVKEKKWAEEMEEDSVKYGLTSEEKSCGEDGGKLSKAELRSLLLILASVALWYIGYNSITSKYTVYATNILSFDFNSTLIVAQAAAIASYIPVGIISTKIGRKKTILAGILMLAWSFIIGIFVKPTTPEVVMYPVFALAGIGWATINVNSFPMAVELAKHGDVGKYTGYYYTASMAAQIVAPILSGVLYDALGMRYTFFSFGALFVVFSFVTMFFVKHGDSQPVPEKSALEHFDVD